MTAQNMPGGNIYEPIQKYKQMGDHKDQLDSVLQYIQNASNYSLYKIQQSLPDAPVLCTYDPLVWLPPELMDKLLIYLGPASCVTMLRVSKSWNRYLTRHCLWYTARHQLGVSDDQLQCLGCPLDDATHLSWLAVTRAALSLYNRLRTKDAFFYKEVIPIQEASGISLIGLYYLTTSKGLVCQYAMHRWAIYDMTSKEVLSSYTANVDYREKITCMRFVDTSTTPNYRTEGIILYGNVMGDVMAALPFAGSTSYTEKSSPFHSGAVFCCDGDPELDLVVSAAADGSITVGCLSRATVLFTDDNDFDVLEVHIFPVQDEMYNIIAFGIENCIQYRWSTKISEEALKRRQRERSRGLSMFNNQGPELFKRFGDFGAFTKKELPAEDTVIVKVAHKSNSTLGCVHVSPNEKSNKILVYDAYTLTLLRSVETDLKISRLEAAGRRFALFTTTSWGLLDKTVSPSFKEEALVLFDLDTAKHLNYIVLPSQNVSCFSTSIRRCTSYDTWWLDELPVGAVLNPIWLEGTCALADNLEENEGDLSNSCSSLSSLSEAGDAAGPPQPYVPEGGAAVGAVADPLVYRPRPKSPVLYITYSDGQVLVVTWKLAPQAKPKPNKTKQE
ncbi:F-box domain [Trinorchestia longiramus]|nr:F-box domain [Trinorchestia longiramus]